MMTTQFRFNDGGGYEQFMGKWSQLAGTAFLDWLGAPSGVRWLDVGCGNGAFTELIVDRTAPASVAGIDPSDAQLAHARSRFTNGGVEFRQGDAMSLPYDRASFDVAVMPLVIFFVPDPAKGVAEMARVVRPGGLVSAYAWDMDGGGFPYESLLGEMRAMNLPVPDPPSADASRTDVMRALWAAAAEDIDTCAITVHRTFADFDDYWATVLMAPSVGATLKEGGSNVDRLKAVMRAKLAADSNGTITCAGTANAIKGRVRR